MLNAGASRLLRSYLMERHAVNASSNTAFRILPMIALVIPVLSGDPSVAGNYPNCENQQGKVTDKLQTATRVLDRLYNEAVASGDQALIDLYWTQINYVNDCCATFSASQGCGCHSPNITSEASYGRGGPDDLCYNP